MPIIVNPGFSWPPETDPVSSPDGRITAIVDPQFAGVLLRADYSDDADVMKVRFERQDGTPVRSGDPAWAPGGWAHAYDHEAALGGGTLWRVVPIHFDGSEGAPSEYVGAVIPALSDGWGWLKPVSDPSMAMLLKVEPPDLSYDGRVDTTSIAGARRPAATWDVLEGFTTQLRSLIRDRHVADQLMALLDEGPVFAQFPACAGLPDFYFIRGKLDLEHVHWDGYPWRRYQWDVIQIDRPDTTGSPLRVPGLSYDTVARDWTTYDQLAATVVSYNDLLAQAPTGTTPREVHRNYNPAPILSEDDGFFWYHFGALQRTRIEGVGWEIHKAYPGDVAHTQQIVFYGHPEGFALQGIPGVTATIRFRISIPEDAPRPFTIRPRINVTYTDSTPTNWSTGQEIVVEPGDTTVILHSVTPGPNADRVTPALLGGRTVTMTQGDSFVIHDGVTLTMGDETEYLFSGEYSPDPSLTPAWTGERNASPSVLIGGAPGGRPPHWEGPWTNPPTGA